jgi:hypothetical protein
MSYRSEFDKARERHDREFVKMGRHILVWWIVAAILSGAFVVTIIWAIIQIVQCLTA